MSRVQEVDGHYHRPGLGESLLASLAEAGFRPGDTAYADLPPLDEMHIRGREATAELAGLGTLAADLRVLDAGSGLGGSARFLAAVYGCAVTGVDLTHELCRSAAVISAAVGLGARTRFVRGSGTGLPLADGSVDVVWTQHAQMNIEAKEAFYRELARVLAPGGQLLFHDVFAGSEGGLEFPVPWAESGDISFLETPERVAGWLHAFGLRRVEWRERTRESLAWASDAAAAHAGASRRPSLVMSSAPTKLANLRRNLEARRLRVIMARYEKPSRPGPDQSSLS